MRATVLAVILCVTMLGATSAAPPEGDRPPLAVKDLNFSDGVVQTTFSRIDAAARALAKPGWTVLPYRNETYRGGPAHFVARWCETGDGKGGCNCSRQAPVPSRYVELHGMALKGPEGIDGLQVYAGYIPRRGWGARLEYSTYNGAAAIGEMFSLLLFHSDFDRPGPGGDGKWALELGNSYFTTSRRVGQLSYQFQVSMYGDPKSWMGDTRTPRDKTVIQYLGSAEGFRDAALAELEALEAFARKQIPSGAAIRQIMDATGARSDMPPKEVPLTPMTQPTKELLATVLNEAIADIEHRRKLVTDHHREMFEATRRAFPLDACIRKGK